MPLRISAYRIAVLMLLFVSTLLLAAPASAKTVKFIYVYNAQAQLLTPLNAAAQCPDPEGGTGVATNCQGVGVAKHGDYSLRLSSADLANSEKYIFVANDYRFIAAGSNPVVTGHTYILQK